MDDFLESRPFQGGGLVVGGPTYAFVGILCRNCGNTQFMNAVYIGIMNPSPIPEGAQQDIPAANGGDNE